MTIPKFSIKDYVLFASLLCNIILGWWIYDMTHTPESANEDLLKSRFRVESLEASLNALMSEYDSLNTANEQLGNEIKSKPKERIVIEKVYDKKISNVINLPIDSSVQYVAKRLSEVDVN